MSGPPVARQALRCAGAVATAFWLPLLALDVGYPSLAQVFDAADLMRGAWLAAGLVGLIAGLLGAGSALAAAVQTKRADARDLAVPAAFCGWPGDRCACWCCDPC